MPLYIAEIILMKSLTLALNSGISLISPPLALKFPAFGNCRCGLDESFVGKMEQFLDAFYCRHEGRFGGDVDDLLRFGTGVGRGELWPEEGTFCDFGILGIWLVLVCREEGGRSTFGESCKFLVLIGPLTSL